VLFFSAGRSGSITHQPFTLFTKDLRVKQVVRWGVLGPGVISRAFAAGLRAAEGAQLLAVGSRSGERAGAFAAEFGVPRSYDSYEALAADDEIDALYVGTPHAFHEAHTTLCLRHKKHVLCEKPLAINAAQARRMIQAAREEDRLLMEAMWTRFLPSLERVLEILADGAIGEPRMLTADLGFHAEVDPSSRLFDPVLGGGALLDLGVYAVSLASLLFGPPVDVNGIANLATTGVDEECSILTRHKEGQMTTALASFRVDTAKEALIQGTRGWIRIHEPWWAPTRVTVKSKEHGEEHIHLPFRGGGFTHEAEAFMELIRNNQRDSSVMPLEESLSIMKVMDTLRRQWGLRYPME
jgi:predicted dehydrogenase